MQGSLIQGPKATQTLPYEEFSDCKGEVSMFSVCMQICGSDWASHNSATGGFYKCNRFRAAVEEEAAGQEGGSVGLRSFLGSVFGRIQVCHLDLCFWIPVLGNMEHSPPEHLGNLPSLPKVCGPSPA